MKSTIKVKGRVRLQKHKLPYFWRKVVQFLAFLNLNNHAAALASRYGVLTMDTGFINNGITNAGKAYLALLTSESGNLFTYLAAGTSSAAFGASQTALQAEITTGGLARATATLSRITTTVTNDTRRLVKVWSATASHSVEEMGIFNAASSGTMLGRALTTTKTVDDEETLTGTYDVIFG